MTSSVDTTVCLFPHNVKLVLVAKDAPYDGDVLDDNVQRDDDENAEKASDSLPPAELLEGEGAQEPARVHVEIRTSDEREEEGHDRVERDRRNPGQQYIRGAQRQADPSVQVHAEDELYSKRHLCNGTRSIRLQDTLNSFSCNRHRLRQNFCFSEKSPF